MPSSTARLLRVRWRTSLAESLEPRWFLSGMTATADVAHSNLVVREAASGAVQGFSPAAIRHAYAFDQIQFSGVAGDGSGQTIAIVDPYDDPNIASDLNVFDQQFGLPAANFSKVYATGTAPRTDDGWSEEIALDVEWAHAIAPGANIVLVEARSDNLSDLLAAVNVARALPGVSVVSMSWGGSEFRGETADDADFTTPAGHQGVTFVAAAGDDGGETIFPSVSPNVLTVGGTTLDLIGGNYGLETAWPDGGGGESQFESEPAYQEGVQSTGTRTAPDVAYDADPDTGMAVYDSLPVSSRSPGGWIEVGGTSAGTPQWAGLVAIADEGRALLAEGSLSNAQSLLYGLPGSDFHDIVSGSNGSPATAGYDLATGLGTPVANLVVAGLIGSPSALSAGGSGSTSGGIPVGGGLANLGLVATSLTDSTEYDADFITRAYQTFLGRAPDSAGLAWWTAQMQSGMSDQQVEAALLASTEYVDLHGGTEVGWLEGIYLDLLNRPADVQGIGYWLGQLQLGVSDDQVALDIADSAEREATLVANDYFTYLGRDAGASEIAYWVAQFQQGVTNEQIVAAITSSSEYYNNPAKGNGTPLGWLDSVFEDLFDRAPTQSEQAQWLALL